MSAASAWTGLPPVQRSLAEPIEPVAPLDTFTNSLATHQNPSFLAPLSHRVDGGTGGLVDGLADLTPGTPKSYAPARDLTVRRVAAKESTARPAVQRLWGSFTSSPDVAAVPMERPALADESEVRQVADAGLVGSGAPDAPLTIAAPAPAPALAEPPLAGPVAVSSTDGGAPALVVPTSGAGAGGASPVTAQRAEARSPMTSAGEGSATVQRASSDDAGPVVAEVPESAEGESFGDAGSPSASTSAPSPSAPSPSAPLTSAQPLTSALTASTADPAPPFADRPASFGASDLPVAPGPRVPAGAGGPAGGAPRSTFSLPFIQRQLSAVPDRPAREAQSPSTPTLELPVLRLVEPSAPRSAPVADLTDTGFGSDAPLSGFAAAIAALNSPGSGLESTDSAGEPTAAPAADPAGSGAALPAVQRSTGPVAGSLTTDTASRPSLAGLPRLPVWSDPPTRTALSSLPTVELGRPAAAASASSVDQPTVSRSVRPAGSGPSAGTPVAPSTSGPADSPTGSYAAPTELPVPTQRAALNPVVDLLGARPLVSPPEASQVELPPAVQPIRFVAPYAPAGPGPTSTGSRGAAAAGGSRPNLDDSPFPLQRLSSATASLPASPAAGPAVSAPGPVRPAAAPALPTPPISAPPTSGSFTSPPAEPGWVSPLTSADLQADFPVGSDESISPAQPDDEAAEAAYEVVQLSALDADGGPGPTSSPVSRTPPVPAPSVQRQTASAGPVAAPVAPPVTMAPPSRIVQRLPSSVSTVGAGPVHHAAGRSSGPVSFAAMFGQVGNSAAEDGYTSVQLTPEDTAPPQAAEPTVAREPSPTASPAAAAGAVPGAAAPADLDEMARRLFEPLTARIKAELWMDRERSGLMTDVRP